ncbi:MAG: hypothetical protein IT373_13335 [Polyangiaceae bacterium]|nr:hypothetical protein [Polyangiaceae bacterium]
MLSRAALVRLLAAFIGLASLGATCGQAGLAVMPGVINNPANHALRQALLGFATSEMCSELLHRSVPLSLRDGDPTIGRFYPQTCQVQQVANENLYVSFAGHGYAWSSLSKRIGFVASAGVQYEYDFLMDGGTMYVYFRQVSTGASEFRPTMVEAPSAGALGPLIGANLQGFVQQLGSRLLAAELAKGFTVVRHGDGDTTFSLGVLETGTRPFAPFDRAESSWPLLANERTEIHTGQRDYTGPYLVDGSGEALYLTLALEGAPAVDVLVVPKELGDAWLGAYEQQGPAGPPPGQPLADEPVAATPTVGTPPPVYRRMFRLPRGSYYIVLDNTATAGASVPAGVPGDDRAALVSYAVQLGDAP